MSWSKKYVLKSSDGEIFEVEEAVALQSQTIAHMIEEGCIQNGIPLSNVTSKILAKVVEYCKKHVVVPNGDGASSSSSSSSKELKNWDKELKNWDKEFISDVIDSSMLFHLIMAANYLNVKGLLDLTCQTVADMLTGKTPDEMRAMLNIENDFTPEEEAQMRAENPWPFGLN